VQADVLTGGVHMVKQGQQRRVVCTVSDAGQGAPSINQSINRPGQLPLVANHITSIAVGCVSARHRQLQRALDSYQESELDDIKVIDCSID